MQSAWAVGRKRDSYFKAQQNRIASRRGRKRALVAVAHSLLTVVYHLLRDGTVFTDLGESHFDRIEPARQARSLVNRLRKMGYGVSIKEEAA